MDTADAFSLRRTRRAFAKALSVISSNVGPMPPVVTKRVGFLRSASLIAVEISSRLSPTVVMRVTSPPSFVTCSAIQDAFVFTVFPRRSSLPIDNSSTVQVNEVDTERQNVFAFNMDTGR